MLDPYDLDRPRFGLSALLRMGSHGQPRVLALLELHMRHKTNGHQQLVNISVRLQPGNPAEAHTPPWERYCERLFCDLRAFLIGGQ